MATQTMTAMTEAQISAGMDDSSLVLRARQGDRGAFRVIVDDHKDEVYRLALGMVRNHHDAEDVVQEVFLKAYRSLGGFRQDARIGTWLHRITVNASIDAMRKKPSGSRRNLMSLDADGQEFELVETRHDANPEQTAASAEVGAHVERAILALTPLEQAVFTLRLYQGLKVGEIAEALDRAEGTIKSMLFRALRKVRKDLVKRGVLVEPEQCR